MSEQIQVYCIEEEPPTLQQVLELLSEEGFDIRFEEDGIIDDNMDREDPSWGEAHVLFSDESEPLHMECWRDEESDEFAEMRDEMLVNLEGVDQPAVEKICKHLESCRFAVIIMAMNDDSEEAQVLLSGLINYLCSSYKGLAYVENEGFYANDDLILEMSDNL